MGSLADAAGPAAKCKGTVCVTGATGFVASWLVKCLLEEGYRVRGTVRDPENVSKAAHLWALAGATERLELMKADLLTEGSYDAAVAGCEGVFHTATALVAIKSDPKAEMIDPAVVGTLNVLRSCANASSVKRVVLTSSSAAVRFNADVLLAPTTVPLDESVWSSVPFCTENKIWYSVAKTLAEQEAWKFASVHHLDLVVILPSFIIGPCLPAHLSKTASDVLNLLKGSDTLGMHGRMGYVHVDDIARAHILVYEEPSAQGRYICSAEEMTPQELLQRLATRYPYLPLPSKFKDVPEVPYYTLNANKVRRLGLEFKSLETMFDDCIAFFKERGLLTWKSEEEAGQTTAECN